jgi:hypothetical protein
MAPSSHLTLIQDLHGASSEAPECLIASPFKRILICRMHTALALQLSPIIHQPLVLTMIYLSRSPGLLRALCLALAATLTVLGWSLASKAFSQASYPLLRLSVAPMSCWQADCWSHMSAPSSLKEHHIQFFEDEGLFILCQERKAPNM